MDSDGIARAASFLESWLPFRYSRADIPGFVVAISHRGEKVFERACGYANLETREELTPGHIFRVASHSKTFAATAIMQLAERGEIDIDKPAAHYLQWLGEHKDKRIAKVTLRQLMCHSTGMIRDGLDSNYWQLSTPFPDEDEFRSEMLKADLVFDNNRQMKYSNFGYTLLGLVLGVVTNEPFNRHVRKSILNPIELASTGPEFHESIEHRLVTGYSRKDFNNQRTPLRKRIDTQAMSAATGFYSTSGDLLTYFNAHFVGSGALLNDESKKEMQRSQWRVQNSRENQEYGLGFEMNYVSNRKLFGHGGGFPGHITRTMCDPNEQLVVVVLTNCIDGEAKMMTKGIVSIIDHFQNSSAKLGDATIKKLERFEGRYMNLWGITEVIRKGNKLLAINPNVWSPFADSDETEELEYVDDVTLKVVKANGYAAEGEFVRYFFQGNELARSIKYCGLDMWLESEYLKRVESEAGSL